MHTIDLIYYSRAGNVTVLCSAAL